MDKMTIKQVVSGLKSIRYGIDNVIMALESAVTHINRSAKPPRRARKTKAPKAERDLGVGTCATCGKTFTRLAKNAKFCSAKCRLAMYQFETALKRHKDLKLEEWLKNKRTYQHITPIPCAVCGKEFKPKRRAYTLCESCSLARKEARKTARTINKRTSVVKKKNTDVQKSSVVQTSSPIPQKQVAIPDSTVTSICHCCQQPFRHPANVDPRYCNKCMTYYGLEECAAIEKEESARLEVEKLYKTSRHKVCCKCGAYFEDTSPGNGRMFCDKCTSQLSKKNIGNSTRKKKKYH